MNICSPWPNLKYITSVKEAPEVHDCPRQEKTRLKRQNIVYSAPWYTCILYFLSENIIVSTFSEWYINKKLPTKHFNLTALNSYKYSKGIACSDLKKIDTPITHWGRVTHICVNKLTIIGSENGLSPGRRQAIILTNAGILLIGPLWTKFSGEILIEI